MIAFVELERVWKETVVTYFKLLSQNSLGQIDENHENRILSLRPTFGLGFPEMQVASFID
jgi:hypothetical protein